MLKNRTRSLVIMGLALLTSLAAWNEGESEITLDGIKTWVKFNDGDTFKVREGQLKGARVRLTGFNALENYGPVHSWADNTPEYLLTVSQEATTMAQQGSWKCKLEGGKDGYGRYLARCDDLAKALIGQGLAHAYSVDEKPAKKSYLTQQKKAQEQKLGMWKYGTPPENKIITSTHSADEGMTPNYNRAIDTLDGRSEKIFHRDNYSPCQKVCIGESSSCMIHVPFNLRYGNNRSECLRTNTPAAPALVAEE